jgi:predicted Zn finger-like uncharacterized protein
MVVTCASCLTKFNLDDSRIPAKGVKVRCSRCKHTFFVVPPPETKEEIIEDAESFAKYHEDLIDSGEKKKKALPEVKVEEKKALPKEEEEQKEQEEKEQEEKEQEEKEQEEKEQEEKEQEAYLFSEKAPEVKMGELPPKQEEELFSKEATIETGTKVKPSKPQRVISREKKRFPHFLALLIILALLVFGFFSLWAELGSGGRISSYIEYPVKKISEFWNELWGLEKGGLIVGEYNGYEERIGLIPIYIIEGKVTNQSRFSKKYIKIRVVIFDQDRLKLAEKEAICGRTISRVELKKEPIEFLKEDLVIKPQTEEEMITPSGKSTPFIVIFKDLPIQAKDFKVEIVEAPNL